MKDLKFLKTISLIICFLALFKIETAFAQSEDIVVNNVYRITHEAYRAANQWYAVRNPWNSNGTRIMIHENASFTHPTYNTTGRGLVWGFLSDLKSWTTQAEYEAAAKPIPKSYKMTTIQSAYWSVLPGEENIIYMPHKGGSPWNLKWLARINVDTGVITNFIDITPPVGVDGRSARCYGWTSDNKLVLSFGNEKWSDGGYMIDVQARTKTFISGRPATPRFGCTPKASDYDIEFWNWPLVSSHGHGDRNPGRHMTTSYGWGINDPRVGAFNYDTDTWVNDPNISAITHVSWKFSNNWYLGSTCGDVSRYKPAPHITKFRLYQIYFDGSGFTHRELLSKDSAGRWDDGVNRISNYHALPIATLREDGRQAMIFSTDGKHSYEDYKYKGVTPWGYEGAFLVDLAPASGLNPPKIKITTP